MTAISQYNAQNCYQPIGNMPNYLNYPYYYYPASSQQVIELQKEVAELKEMMRQCLKELLYLAR